MERIKKFIKETNTLAIFSFLIAILTWLVGFLHKGCDNTTDIFGAGAVLLGIIALIWLRVKKQKGIRLAILGIVIGGVGSILLVSLC